MCQSWFASKDVLLFTYNLRYKSFSEFGGGKDSRAETGHTSNALLNTSCPVGSSLMEQAQFLAQA